MVFSKNSNNIFQSVFCTKTAFANTESLAIRSGIYKEKIAKIYRFDTRFGILSNFALADCIIEERV